MLLTKTKTNLLLSFILILYLFCCSKYIGKKNTIFSNQIYLLFLLICVIIAYSYHKQAGITLLIIALATHSPVFREAFNDFTDTVSNKIKDNELENQESNYDISVKLRKNQLIEEKLKQEEPRMNQLEKEGIIQPLEKEIIREIQRKFEEDIDLIVSDDFEKISKFTDEGDPINAGLLPKSSSSKSNYDNLDYENLVKTGKLIKF
jgi:hypothetical protein